MPNTYTTFGVRRNIIERCRSNRNTWDCFGSTRSSSTNVTFSKKSTLDRARMIQHDTPVAPSRGFVGSSLFNPGARAPGYNLSSLRDWRLVERSRQLFLFTDCDDEELV